MSTGFPKNLTFSSSNSLIYPKNKIKIVIYLFESNFKKYYKLLFEFSSIEPFIPLN